MAENVTVGNHVTLGCGEEAENVLKPAVYAFGLATVGEQSVIPDNVKIGRNTAISGVTATEDYPGGNPGKLDRSLKQRMVSRHESNWNYSGRRK